MLFNSSWKSYSDLLKTGTSVHEEATVRALAYFSAVCRHRSCRALTQCSTISLCTTSTTVNLWRLTRLSRSRSRNSTSSAIYLITSDKNKMLRTVPFLGIMQMEHKVKMLKFPNLKIEMQITKPCKSHSHNVLPKTICQAREHKRILQVDKEKHALLPCPIPKGHKYWQVNKKTPRDIKNKAVTISC